MLESLVEQLTNTLLVTDFTSPTTVVIFKVTVSPLAKFPIVHLPLSESYWPLDALAEIKVRPLGKTSSTYASTATLGPLLTTLIIQTTLLPE